MEGTTMRDRDDGRGDDLQEGFSKSRTISGKAIGLIVLAVILLILILQNSEKRSVQILSSDTPTPARSRGPWASPRGT